jgi:NAD(P)-dependent dehydrogenase (short-subunit alcohol dehydrogenase family)
MRFTEKCALVIGATEGIGRATARAFCEEGANVVVAGLGADRGHALVQELASLSKSQTVFVECDVTREQEVRQLMDLAVRRFGRIHAAVNNAGIEGPFGPIQERTSAEFDQVVGVNLKGVWLGMKYQIPHMLENGGGAIVNTASSAGVRAIANVAIYTASKHGVVGLTKAAALEVAKSNIRINAVAPGPVDTGLLHRMVGGHIDLSVIAEKVPMGRISQPDEIAQTILWLCSDAASFITAQTIVVDGGLTQS